MREYHEDCEDREDIERALYDQEAQRADDFHSEGRTLRGGMRLAPDEDFPTEDCDFDEEVDHDEP